MSEFTMHDYTEEDMESIFEGMKKYIHDTSSKEKAIEKRDEQEEKE